MKKQDIHEHELYAVRAPGEYVKSGATVIAEVIEVGVERDTGRRRGQPKLRDGVKVKLREPWTARHYGFGAPASWEVGAEVFVSSAEVVRPVEYKDLELAAERERIRDMNSKADELLKALGLAVSKPGDRLNGVPATPGYALGRDGRTTVDTGTLVEWLERIDPVEQARLVVREVYNSRPMEEGEFEEAVDVALDRLRGFLSREPQQPPAPPVEQAPSADGVEF